METTDTQVRSDEDMAELPGQRAWEDAERRQRAELARRLEQAIKRVDEIREELDALAFDLEAPSSRDLDSGSVGNPIVSEAVR